MGVGLCTQSIFHSEAMYAGLFVMPEFNAKMFEGCVLKALETHVSSASGVLKKGPSHSSAKGMTAQG